MYGFLLLSAATIAVTAFAAVIGQLELAELNTFPEDPSKVHFCNSAAIYFDTAE